MGRGHIQWDVLGEMVRCVKKGKHLGTDFQWTHKKNSLTEVSQFNKELKKLLDTVIT